MNTKKLTVTAILIAINVVLSSIIVIPVGPIKVLCAVFVGPWYGLAQALISSIIRITFNTGSFFAFPGSMIGVFLASLFYMYKKHIFIAAIGEVIGTGIIGSLMCIPMAWILGFHNFVVKPLMLAFIVSSVIGAVISYILLIILKKRGLLDRFK